MRLGMERGAGGEVQSYSFLSKKGGVGKTTFALNCAHALAFSGFRTLLVDLDAQSNLTRHLLGAAGGEKGAAASPDMSKLLLGRAAVDDAVVETGYEGLHLIPGSPELDDLPILDPRVVREPARLKSLLAPLSGEYDYLLIDCPPALNWVTRMALMATGRVILPTQPEAYALRGLEDLVPWLDKMSSMARLYRIVLNMVRANTQLHQALTAQIEASYPGRVAQQRVRLTIDLAEAARAGLSVFEHAPASAAAMDLYALCFELFELSAEAVREKIRDRARETRAA
jgi:chromosome partitioning protein